MELRLRARLYFQNQVCLESTYFLGVLLVMWYKQSELAKGVCFGISVVGQLPAYPHTLEKTHSQ